MATHILANALYAMRTYELTSISRKVFATSYSSSIILNIDTSPLDEKCALHFEEK